MHSSGCGSYGWKAESERMSDVYESLIYLSRIFILWEQRLDVVIRAHTLIKT